MLPGAYSPASSHSSSEGEKKTESTPAEGQVGVPQLLWEQKLLLITWGLLKIRQSLGMDSEGPDRSTALCPSHHCPGPLCP